MPSVPERKLSLGEQSALQKAQQAHALREAAALKRGATKPSPASFNRLRPGISLRKGY
jgi:hypothetical protein